MYFWSVRAAQPGGLSYSYIEGDYINLNIDEVGDSGSVLDDLDNGGGWDVRGAFGLAPNWFAFGQYSVTDSDISFTDDLNQRFSSDTDINRLDLGGAFHSSVNSNTDLVLRTAYTDVDTDGFNFGGSSNVSIGDLNDDSSDGLFIDAASRSQLMEPVEGNLMYEFIQELGLNLGLEAGDDISYILIGLRYSF